MKPGFRGKLLLGFFGLLMFQGLITFLWFSHAMKSSVLDEIKNRGLSTGTSLAVGLVEPLLAMDYLRMKTIMDETTRLDNDIFIPLSWTRTAISWPIPLKMGSR
jgi:two-component system NtrC family sensor kinase